MTELHPTIRHLEMPARIKALPLTENGYPVLYFADMLDGKPDLRVMDPRKRLKCIREKLCWLCGQPLGRNMVFVLGPMCCVTRTSSEPPCHYDCAVYAVKACPFLTRPQAHRRETGLPEGTSMPGCGIKRNPGVAALWVARSYRTFQGNGLLIEAGEPERVEWWAEGRQATYAEVAESLESGAPLLFEQCEKDADPELSRRLLAERFAGILPLLRGLPGREERQAEDAGLNEAVLLAIRADEVAWFASHPTEESYVRPAIKGEYPPQHSPTHVRVRRLDPQAEKRVREFGTITGGNFVVTP